MTLARCEHLVFDEQVSQASQGAHDPTTVRAEFSYQGCIFTIGEVSQSTIGNPIWSLLGNLASSNKTTTFCINGEGGIMNCIAH